MGGTRRSFRTGAIASFCAGTIDDGSMLAPRQSHGCDRLDSLEFKRIQTNSNALFSPIAFV
ncbi:MAG: hypothetical protein D6680_13120 [Cyanobacteria bacterium J007]|nr:MAG: hypothetical protein D6680_13120 [Cyanobacteria bacterium J007]